MEKLAQKVDAIKTRTNAEKVLKEAVLYLLEKAPKPVELEDPIEENNLDTLKEWTRENEIEVGGDRNKADYVRAVKAHLGLEEIEE